MKDYNKIFKKNKRKEEENKSYLSRTEDGKNCYGKISETPYGNRLKYTYVKDLIEIWECENDKNSAIFGYMVHLDSDQKIALYWC